MSRFAILIATLMVLAGSTALASLVFYDSGDSSRRVPVVESPTDRAIAALQEGLAAKPDDVERLNELGFAYLQKARESGDPSFYSKADAAFERVLGLNPSDQPGLIGASSVAAARHDFRVAFDFAQQAVDNDPEDADAQGALGDALIELGRYEEALEAFQRMIDARPDLNAYVRISYARELHGDIDGAIEAMGLAIEASRPTGETAAWVHWQLGNLYFNSGSLDGASEQYDASRSALPGYVHAVAGQARVAAARDDIEQAIELYNEVVARQPILEHVAALGDVYAAAGREAEAQRQYELVAAINELYKANGIETGLETAIYLADHDLRPDDAVTQALAVYEQQPQSIRAADALSWALYKAGRFEEAAIYSERALRLGTRDPLLLFHAGMINYEAGQREVARDYLSQAVAANPRFSVLHADQAETVLDELKTSVRDER